MASPVASAAGVVRKLGALTRPRSPWAACCRDSCMSATRERMAIGAVNRFRDAVADEHLAVVIRGGALTTTVSGCNWVIGLTKEVAGPKDRSPTPTAPSSAIKPARGLNPSSRPGQTARIGQRSTTPGDRRNPQTLATRRRTRQRPRRGRAGQIAGRGTQRMEVVLGQG